MFVLISWILWCCAYTENVRIIMVVRISFELCIIIINSSLLWNSLHLSLFFRPTHANGLLLHFLCVLCRSTPFVYTRPKSRQAIFVSDSDPLRHCSRWFAFCSEHLIWISLKSVFRSVGMELHSKLNDRLQKKSKSNSGKRFFPLYIHYKLGAFFFLSCLCVVFRSVEVGWMASSFYSCYNKLGEVRILLTEFFLSPVRQFSSVTGFVVGRVWEPMKNDHFHRVAAWNSSDLCSGFLWEYFQCLW